MRCCIWCSSSISLLSFFPCTSTFQVKVDKHKFTEKNKFQIRCLKIPCYGSFSVYRWIKGTWIECRSQIIKDICEGLYHLHMENHIIHMGLKPANILLDQYMVPKVTDFGLSRLDENSQTMSANRFYHYKPYITVTKLFFKVFLLLHSQCQWTIISYFSAKDIVLLSTYIAEGCLSNQTSIVWVL